MTKLLISNYLNWERALVGAVLISCYVLTPSAVFAQTFDHDLYYGVQNSQDVIKLQDFLTSETLYSGPLSGNFYSLTLAGVKAFQVREGITPPGGYFGPKTRLRANTILGENIDA